MAREDIRRTFFRYVFFNIAGMIGLSCYILADTFFVARGVGATGLTALNLAIPVYSLISGTGLMTGMGGAIRYSLSGAKEAFTQSLYCVVIASCVFLAAAFFSDPISALLGADKETLGYTSVYLKTILCFSPAFMLNNCVLCFVRNDGSPGLAMAGMVAGSIMNIIMDYIFVFPLKMEMFGAALATGFSPVISLMILSLHFIKRKNTFSVIKQLPSLKAFADISALGVSSLITEVSSGVVMLVFNIRLLDLSGNTGVAAYGIIANIALVIISVFTGISQGMQPVVSSCAGKNDSKGASAALRYGIITSVVFSLIVYMLTFVFAEAVVSVFNRDGDAVLADMAEKGLRLYFTSFIFSGINILVSAFLSSQGEPKNAFIISVLRGFAVIIPMVIILSAIFGVNGVWISMTAAEFIVMLFGIYCILHRPL